MKTVIEMAQQTLNRDRLGFWAAGMGDLEAFAALVRTDEREACAALCDEVDKESQSQWPKRLATMIRARGNT
jgi:hypothetical protein